MDTEHIKTLQMLSELFRHNNWVQLAQEAGSLIDEINKRKESKSYGLFMHIAATFLGLAALENKDIELAKTHLINSLSVPPSPYLKSAGPTMMVAKKLYDLGEHDIVSKYVDLCKSQWGFPLKYYYIWKWKRSIAKGKIVDFHPYTNLYIKYPLKIPE